MTAAIDPRLAGLARFMEAAIPFNRHAGLVVERLEPGRCLLRLPWAEHFVGDPLRPAVHGGVTSALLDNAGGVAVFSTFTGPNERASTIDLRVDYLGPGPCGRDLFAEAEVVRRGSRVAFTRMQAFSDAAPGPGRAPFAIAQATYSIFQADGRPDPD